MTQAVLDRIGTEIASTPPAPATLAEELALRGITPYDTAKVQRFKQDYDRRQREEGATGIYAAWQPLPLGEYLARVDAGTADTGGDLYSAIPSGVQETIGRAMEVPGSAIVVERYDRDPFVRIDLIAEDGEVIESAYIAHFASDFQP